MATPYSDIVKVISGNLFFENIPSVGTYAPEYADEDSVGIHFIVTFVQYLTFKTAVIFWCKKTVYLNSWHFLSSVVGCLNGYCPKDFSQYIVHNIGFELVVWNNLFRHSVCVKFQVRFLAFSRVMISHLFVALYSVLELKKERKS